MISREALAQSLKTGYPPVFFTPDKACAGYFFIPSTKINQPCYLIPVFTPSSGSLNHV
jgi:hypothetical protein